MKHFVTVLLLTAGLVGAVSAQSIVAPSSPVPPQVELTRSFPITLPNVAPPPVPTESVVYLNYVDLQSSTLRYYYYPNYVTYTLPDKSTFRDTMVTMSQHFTSPYTVGYLDSIRFTLGVAKLAQFENNQVNVSLFRASKGTDGIWRPSTKVTGTDHPIDLTQLVVGEPNDISLGFNRKRLPGKDFFVSVYVAYDVNSASSDQNVIGIFGDSIDYTTYDPEIDRAYTSGLHYGSPYAGFTAEGSQIEYAANMFMEAKVTDAPVSVGPDGQPIFALEQNFPNPFNPSTDIRYSLAKTDHVSLKLMNALGQEVKTLVDGTEAAGDHTVKVDAANLTSGTYFYTLRANGKSETRQMILNK